MNTYEATIDDLACMKIKPLVVKLALSTVFLLVATMTSENPNYGGLKYPEVGNQEHAIGLC